MFEMIFFLIVLLIVFGLSILIVVGVFIGIAYLMIYFLPGIDLATALIPASILTTVPIIMMSNIFKQWAIKSNRYLDLEDYEGEE